MLARTLRSLLDLSPRGLTNDQLLWRLLQSGLRMDASELLAALEALSRSGEVQHRRGRWHARRTSSLTPSPPNSGTSGIGGTGDSDVLRASPGRAIPNDMDPSGGIESNDVPGEALGALPPWDSLLAYFAATQRQDPRGRIAEFPDRHGQAWLMFTAPGRWWQEAKIVLSIDALPHSFPEALFRRRVHVAALGWPLTVFGSDAGTTIVPALIVPAEWRSDSDRLTLTPTTAMPSVNPEWLRAVCTGTRWSQGDLLDTLFPVGEDHDLGAVGERLRHALSSFGGGALRPGDLEPAMGLFSDGLRNAAAVFLPDDTTFTGGVAADLETLRRWRPEERGACALGALLEGAKSATQSSPTAMLAPAPLSEVQEEAVDTALEGPLTLVQGPPGTGKSQVILTVLVSALLAGRSVLFAARNHQAVDEVEQRLVEIVPDAGVLVRARDADGERDSSFLDALAELSTSKTRSPDLTAADALARVDVQSRASIAAAERRAQLVRLKLNLVLADCVDRAVTIQEALHSAERPGQISSRRWALRLRAWLSRRRADSAEPLPQDASLARLEAEAGALRNRLEGMEARAMALGAAIEPAEVRSLLGRCAPGILRPDETERLALVARRKELEFDQVRSVRKLSPEDARAVLRRRPIWAVSTLSAPARIPLIPGLFDWVVFDEASQCDIASALPLMARARRAVIVGDPQQLGFVPGLAVGAEHALMDAAGLPRQGRARIAQSRNSLFDFMDGLPNVARRFLPDQFRSAPAIVGYLGDEFYDGRLVGQRDEAAFRTPSGYRPGLAWEDVPGRGGREEGGNVNPAEAERVVALLRRLTEDSGFDGSVGVVAPFNAQVALIQRKVRAMLDAAKLERLSLRVGTVDRWQGGEADVVLVSLTLAPGSAHSARMFLQRERRRLNVAISRARALCLVVGDLAHARGCGIRHLERLAEHATSSWSPPRPPFDSLWERRLYTAMRDRGLDPFPQYPIGTRYLDFALDPEGRRIDVEVDGRRWHLGPDGTRKVADRLRDAELTARGWKIIRFWVHELDSNMEGCLERIEREFR